jgi:hypothetical protein
VGLPLGCGVENLGRVILSAGDVGWDGLVVTSCGVIGSMCCC